MANKITLDTITSSFASNTLFNTNFAAIKTELDNKVLYRDNPTGEANQMLNDLDMNSNDILNTATVNADIIVLNGTQITPTGTTSLPASSLTYDGTTSGLSDTNVQDAIDTVATHGSNYGKNLIINGDFSIWQRGTTHSTTGYGSADRWRILLSGGAASLTQQVFTLGQIDVPANPKYYSSFAVTTGDNNCGLQHRIETVAPTANREVTLSFWAKGTNPGGGNLSVTTIQDFGTGGSPSTPVEVDQGSLTLTASWQKFTYTFTPASITGKTLGTSGDHFQVDFRQPDGDASTSAWTLDIANVQLEFGDTATEFEYVSPADQLARCQRYFERIAGVAGDEVSLGLSFAVGSTTISSLPLNFTEKRATPAFTLDGTLSSFDSAALTVTSDSLNVNDASVTSARLNFVRTAGTHAAGDVFATRLTAGTTNSLSIDAEL